jgi:hypothetical protein
LRLGAALQENAKDLRLARSAGVQRRAVHTMPMRCCVCGEEIFDQDESAFGACADCLDNVQRDPDHFIESLNPKR